MIITPLANYCLLTKKLPIKSYLKDEQKNKAMKNKAVNTEESKSNKVEFENELDKEIDKKLKENHMALDAELLSSIPGGDQEAASYILSELGNNMEHFPDEQHLALWAGLSLGNNESAGKKKVRGQPMGING